MSVLARIAAAKEQAEFERDRGHYEQAACVLNQAIADLELAIGTSSAEDTKVAAELADAWGMLGGIRKRQRDLMAAARAYDTGFQYESDPKFRVVSTYNALNRIIVRILMSPESLTSASAADDVDIPRELSELRSELSSNGAHENDYWAAGNLAVVCALLQDDSGLEAAARRFVSLSPPATASAAVWTTLAELVSSVPDLKPFLDKLKHLLTPT